MGAWGTGTFENDGALDWLAELRGYSDTSFLAKTLLIAWQVCEDYLDASDCANGLAAGEILAALRGNPMPGLPGDARAWVDAHGGLEIAGLAKQAAAVAERIRTDSELRSLWLESGELEAWQRTVADLTRRLTD